MKKVSVYDCSFVELPKITVGERQGNLTPIYNNEQVPFDVKRVFYSYDIPGGEARGAHAHKECHQFLIAASGSFEVALDDGTNKRTVLLNRPFYGLHIPPGIWAAEQGFSSGAICLVLASHSYQTEDYIRDYDDYLKYINENMANIHPLADCKSDNIGEGTNIWQFCVIFKNAKIGKNCNICANVLVEDDVIIGNNVTIKSGVQLWNGARIEDNVFIAPNVTFTNEHFSRSKQYPDHFEQTIIKKGASLGANCTVVCGNTVGEYALVGAGSVVTKDVPPYTVWYGNPAVQRGYITMDGEILDMNKRNKNGEVRDIPEAPGGGISIV